MRLAYQIKKPLAKRRMCDPVFELMVGFRHSNYHAWHSGSLAVRSPIHCHIGIPTCVARS